MCGIFGFLNLDSNKISESISKKEFNFLVKHAEQRGKDSSGFTYLNSNKLEVYRFDKKITDTIKYSKVSSSSLCYGHSRLITNGVNDNQPVVLRGNVLVHNGIIINHKELFNQIKIKRTLEIDSEIILALFEEGINSNMSLSDNVNNILKKCKGTISAVLYSKYYNTLILFSNNGSLYAGIKNNTLLFSSEKYPLRKINSNSITQIFKPILYSLDKSINKSNISFSIKDFNSRDYNIIPELGILDGREKLLEYNKPNLKRCTKCILPETMPFITFDKSGVCNYCNNYKLRNVPKPIDQLKKIVDPYKRKNERDCIVPFSGGRDSCFGLHLVVKELGMKPITYTYDWGMVTDLARRNISRFCSKLGVENIIIADNIEWKRKNVRKNILAWLKYPDLGMVNLFTAGDKHFFRYVELIKKQIGINIDLWSVNPLEVTHFKSGFLGVKPDFEEDKVYSNGVIKQLNYQKLRFKAMLKSPSYFNASLFDSLYGEYYRSFNKKKDYYHIFDYYRWDEDEINDVILNDYEFEKAPDTSTTWRIGDGTAAFYNYIYYTLAGFSEHDTFRSNQIREGQISRSQALKLVEDENQPRFMNISWYLDTVGLDYTSVIKKINNSKKMYEK